jgi:capsular polysaccharide biosynthesis protein
MSDNQKRDELQPVNLIGILQHFARIIRRFWVLVLALTVLAAAVQGIRAYRSFVPMYEAKAQFTVNSGYTSDDIFTATFYNNMAAKDLAEAFPHMLRMDLMQDLMKQQLGTGWINGTITPQVLPDTNIFTLTVRSTDAKDAYNILCAVID